MPDLQIRYATTSDGTSIAYSMMGEGPPLVYASNLWGDIHWYTNNEPTRREIDRLARAGWQVVRYDCRGFGSSDREVSDFSLEAKLSDLEAVVDDAALENFVLCGYIHGGPVAVSYAVEHARRVSHLVLVNAYAVGSAYYELLPVGQALRAMRTMAAEQWEFFTLTVANATLGFSDMALARKTADLYRTSASPTAYLAFFNAVEETDVRDILPDVRVPTLILLDKGGYATQDLSRHLASAIPNARYISTNDYPGELHRFVRGGALPVAGTEGGPHGTAIILFADIVDSTVLTERLGDAAFRDKARDLDGALRTIIRERAGTPIEGKLLGDGVLATFASARQAIEAALVCATAGNDGGLPLHLGLHAGDVIREENNVFGGAVNVAARISGRSEPGEVLVSDIVRGLARTSAGVKFEDRGEQALKGVGEPVRMWAVRQAD
jgi:class 3 adenylate cyclase